MFVQGIELRMFYNHHSEVFHLPILPEILPMFSKHPLLQLQALSNVFTCVVFPHLSTPSNIINEPRFDILQ